jgi:hypothetical protein
MERKHELLNLDSELAYELCPTTDSQILEVDSILNEL